MSDEMKDTVLIRSEQDFAETFFAKESPPWMLEFGGASDIGKRRSRNEDHFAIFRFRRGVELLLANLSPDELPLRDSCSHALVVADGMGGMNSGDVASRLALQTMLELCSQATSWVTQLEDFDDQQIEQRVSAYVDRVHATLRRVGRDDPTKSNMGTTWTSAHLLGRFAVVVHLGDSRCYLCRDGQLEQVTRDDTMAQALADSGIVPEQASRFRNVLLNCIGAGNERARASVHHFELQVGDRILLCTDGLTNHASDEEIARLLGKESTPQAACDQLVQMALDRGGKDNVTVVLANIRDPGTKSPLTIA
jgi:PPM family protein phosphatase